MNLIAKSRAVKFNSHELHFTRNVQGLAHEHVAIVLDYASIITPPSNAMLFQKRFCGFLGFGNKCLSLGFLFLNSIQGIALHGFATGQ